jgi:hypothetical protein
MGDDPDTSDRAGDGEDQGSDNKRGEQRVQRQAVVADQVDRDHHGTIAPPTLTAIVVLPDRTAAGTR